MMFPGVASEGIPQATDAAVAETSEVTDAETAAPEAMPVTGDAPPDATWLAVASGVVLLAAGLLLRRGLRFI
jgi:hypothetical protein